MVQPRDASPPSSIGHHGIWAGQSEQRKARRFSHRRHRRHHLRRHRRLSPRRRLPRLYCSATTTPRVRSHTWHSLPVCGTCSAPTRGAVPTAPPPSWPPCACRADGSSYVLAALRLPGAVELRPSDCAKERAVRSRLTACLASRPNSFISPTTCWRRRASSSAAASSATAPSPRFARRSPLSERRKKLRQRSSSRRSRGRGRGRGRGRRGGRWDERRRQGRRGRRCVPSAPSSVLVGCGVLGQGQGGGGDS